MTTWILIAALATFGVTALLVGMLYRLNAPRTGKGDGGGYVADGGDRTRDHADAGDGGGGDGGGD